MIKDFYSIKEFALKLHVCELTIRRAIKNGRINAFRCGSTEKSPFRIPHSEIGRMGIIDLEKTINALVDKKIKEREAK